MNIQNNDLIFGDTNQLRPHIGFAKVKPVADISNFQKIHGHSLLMRESKGSMYGGRMSMTWWAVWVSIPVFIGFWWVYVHQLNNGVDEGFTLILVCSLVFPFVGCLHFFIRWRNELPICFNRKTRKVSFMVKNYFSFKRHFAQVDWDDIEAYAKSVRTAAASGALMKEQIVAFKLYYPNRWEGEPPHEHNVTILSSESWNLKDPVNGAKAVWQFIYLFMQKPEEPLLTPVKMVCSLPNIIRENNPITPWSPNETIIYKVISTLLNIVLLPISIPHALLNIVTDIIYCFLDRVLPRRKPPKALQEAIDAVR